MIPPLNRSKPVHGKGRGGCGQVVGRVGIDVGGARCCAVRWRERAGHIDPEVVGSRCCGRRRRRRLFRQERSSCPDFCTYLIFCSFFRSALFFFWPPKPCTGPSNLCVYLFVCLRLFCLPLCIASVQSVCGLCNHWPINQIDGSVARGSETVQARGRALLVCRAAALCD